MDEFAERNAKLHCITDDRELYKGYEGRALKRVVEVSGEDREEGIE